MILVILGEFYLDVEEMSLSKDGQSIVLEPKVLEVLLYFIDNKQHYISLQELHENLWQGRIVSDAAVRRIVSKLRILFGDDHKKPNYIKSLPKKGYKLICRVEKKEIDIQANGINKTKNNNTTNNSSKELEASSLNNPPIYFWSKNKKTLLLLLSSIILLIIAVLFYQNVIIKKDKHDKLIVEKTPSLPGNKIAIAQSIDKKYFAFSGKVDDDIGYQIYLKESNKNDFKLISQRTYFPIGIAFSADNKSLFYVDFKEGSSSLKKINLTTKQYETVTLIDNFNVIAKVFTSIDNHLVYFSGQKTANSPLFIYQYNIETKKLTQKTSSTNENTFDVMAEMSPDGKKLLILQREKYNNNNNVRIVDMINNNILYRYQQALTIYDIKWENNNSVILLDKNSIFKINYKEDKKSIISDNSLDLKVISGIDGNHFFSIQSLPSHKLFLEQKLPFKDWAPEHVFNIDNKIYELSYMFDEKFKLALINDNNTITLAKIDIEKNKVTSLISTKYPIEIISSERDIILLKINRRFALFNLKNSELKYLTNSDDFIGDAAFARNNKSIFFSIRDYQGWKIKRYNLDSNSSILFIKNYRFIRPYYKDFIIGDEDGNMSLLNNKTGKVTKLNYKLSGEPDTSWFVTESFIYWSTHDLVNISFHQLNISDFSHPKLETKIFKYNKVRAEFSINSNGSSLIYSQRKVANDNIVKVTM